MRKRQRGERIIELLEGIQWELEQARDYRAVTDQYPTRVTIVDGHR